MSWPSQVYLEGIEPLAGKAELCSFIVLVLDNAGVTSAVAIAKSSFRWSVTGDPLAMPLPYFKVELEKSA